jgi:hypothetical protein
MITIGRRDRIDLPELGLANIEAKVDTGAYGCALHCHTIIVISKEDKEVLTFKVLDPDHPEYEDKVFRFEDFDDKLVKSSSGGSEHRYTIKTNVVIFGKTRKAEFSLTDRKDMKYPILLGRKFLKKRFLVDVELKDVSFKLKNPAS